jgi:hypothetical protein
MQTRSAAARSARLALRHPQSDSAFAQGLGSVLRQWTALELAIYHEWGGDNGLEMANGLIEEINDLFYMEDKVYKDVNSFPITYVILPLNSELLFKIGCCFIIGGLFGNKF